MIASLSPPFWRKNMKMLLGNAMDMDEKASKSRCYVTLVGIKNKWIYVDVI